MTRDSENHECGRSNEISLAWAAFADKLATALGKMEEDQFLVLSVKRSSRYVQFAAQGAFGMRIETTSNTYLDNGEELDEREIATLLKVGWHKPTVTSANATAAKEPDGSPNFFCDFPAPVSVTAVAHFAVETFAEVMRVPHPGYLQYEAFDSDRNELVLPDLGLKLGTKAPREKRQLDLPHELLATLRQATSIDDLEFDDDGDAAIGCGSAVVFVRLIGDQQHVRFNSRILSDVADDPQILARLNDINANEALVRFVFRNQTIYGFAEICAAPFVPAHVVQALGHFCVVADCMGALLQREFGGRTALVESTPSSTKH